MTLESYNHHFQFFYRSIHTKITNSHEFVDEWLIRPLDVINKSEGDTVLVVGFNVEIADGAVATIHLCYDDNCLIYHKPREESMPLSLTQLLSHRRCVCTGFGLERSQLDTLKREVESDSYDIPNHYQCLTSFAEDIVNFRTPDLFILTNVLLVSHNVVRPQPGGRLEKIEYGSIGVYLSCNIGKLLWEVTMGHRQRRLLFIDNFEVKGAIRKVYEVRAFDQTIITTTVTNSVIAVENWIADVIDDSHLYDYVGFNLQFYIINNKHYIYTVQFCVDTRCLVIHFSRMTCRYLPKLEHFLVLDNNTFVGIDIQRKMSILKDYLLFEYGGPLKVIDLGINAAATLGRPDLRKAGLNRLARQLLGRGIEMPAYVENDTQVQYVRIDSAAYYEIANRLRP